MAVLKGRNSPNQLMLTLFQFVGSKTSAVGQPRSHLFLQSLNVQVGVEAEWKMFDHTATTITCPAVPSVPLSTTDSELKSRIVITRWLFHTKTRYFKLEIQDLFLVHRLTVSWICMFHHYFLYSHYSVFNTKLNITAKTFKVIFFW